MSTLVPTWPTRRTFRDPDLQYRFERDGYVVIPFLTPEQVVQARASWTAPPAAGKGFETDFERVDPARKTAIHTAIASAWQPLLEQLLDDHRAFMTSFLAKWPGAGSGLYVHQDWAYVDERHYRSAVVWVALDDTDERLGNGPLQVLPGSHRVAGEHRGTRTTPWHAAHADAVRKGLVTVPARAGDAVIMDNALIHASPDNTSGQLRLAVAVAVVPAEAGLIHAAIDDRDGTVRTVSVDDRFFREQTPALLREGGLPEGLVPADLADRHTWRPPDLELFAQLAGTADADGDPATLGGSEPPVPHGGLADRAFTQVLIRNHHRIEVADPAPGPFLAPETWPWIGALQAASGQLAAEYLAAVDPHDGPESLRLLSGAELPNVGAWDALLLRDNLGWDDVGIEACPTAHRFLAPVSGLRSAMFSVLGPWARIGPHRGANKGVLRAHVGIIVPGEPGRVTLWAGDEQRSWAPGSAFVFDDTYEHRVANRTDGWRVSLMVEFDRPSTGVDRVVNRAVQHAMRWTPQVRGSRARRRDLRRALAV